MSLYLLLVMHFLVGADKQNGLCFAVGSGPGASRYTGKAAEMV